MAHISSLFYVTVLQVRELSNVFIMVLNSSALSVSGKHKIVLFPNLCKFDC